MTNWISDYLNAEKAALDSIDMTAVAQLIDKLRHALQEERQIFVFGNGGSAANASHFVTDLGKGSSDKIGKRFRCLSLNDNVSWMTALGNDYAYEDIFVRQLQNFARSKDVVMVLSVSGNSPNLVKAVEWSIQHGVATIALVGASRGRLAEIAHDAIVINSDHYGRVEDAHMAICHMLCYAFMENPELGK
jgi:D-sedoheptulose 7-phosphate isomerase